MWTGSAQEEEEAPAVSVIRESLTWGKGRVAARVLRWSLAQGREKLILPSATASYEDP